MEWSGDVLAEVVRLAGATLMATAVGLSILGERRPDPFAVAVAGILVLLAGSVALLIATVAPFAARFDEPLLPLALEYLQDSEHGPRIFAPLLPGVFVLVIWQGLPQATRPMPRRVVHGLLIGVLAFIPVVIAASGHSASTDLEHAAMVAHMIHLACALAWVALVASLLPRMARREPLGPILKPAGNLAAGLVAVLVVTGVFAAWIYGAPLPWPLDEGYGQLLLIKTGALTLALAAAGCNRFVFMPAMREPAIRRTLGFEAAVLLGILVLAAWLSRTPPP